MKKNYIVPCIILFLLLAFQAYAQDYNYYNNLAKQEKENKNYYKVIDYANESLKLYPNGTAYWWRALARYNLNNFEDAEKDYTTALSYYSSNTDLSNLYCNRGDCWYQLKLYTSALSDYKLADSYGYEDKLYIKWSIAGCYYGLGDNANAVDAYTAAIGYASKSSDLASLYKFRGDCYVDMLQYDKAISDFSSAVYYNPEFIKAYWQRAYCYGKTFEYEKALQDCQSAIDISEKQSGSNTDLAILYNNRSYYNNQLGKSDQAVKDGLKSTQLDPTYGKGFWTYASALEATNQKTEAIKNYIQATQLITDNYSKAQCYKDLISLEESLLLYGNAIKHCNEAINTNPDYKWLFWERGWLYAYKKDYTKALADYDKTATLYSNDTFSLQSIYDERGKIKAKLNNYPGAIKDFQAAITLNPKSLYGYEELGRFYKYDLKSKELADMNFKKIMDDDMKDDTCNRYSYSAALMGKLDEAVQNQNRIIAKSNGDLKIISREYYNLACIYAICNNPLKAIETLDKAFATGYENYDHMYNDVDVDKIRALPQFKALLVKYHVPSIVY